MASYSRPMNLNEKRAYTAIIKHKSDFGVYRRVCGHLHTPASHDYQLLEEWDKNEYKKADEDEIFALCMKNHVFPGNTSISTIRTEDYIGNYRDKKELFSYMLLANEIIESGIEIVIVSDHNTVDGCEKLELAIKHVNRMKKKQKVAVIYGVEVSCADLIHVVGIFDRSQIQKIKDWLGEYLVGEGSGTYLTSLDVIRYFYSIRGMAYIAHINSSDILKEKLFSLGYKKKLFQSKELRLIGVNGSNEVDRYKNYIFESTGELKNFVLDCDAHHINGVRKNNYWLKCNKASFEAIMEAYYDYDVSILLHEPTNNHVHIRGIYIENSEKGFLQGSEGDGFCLTFSDALNCIIGGRGTGKSTVIDMLSFALSQRCIDDDTLDFICSHGNVWVLIENNGKEYLVEQELPYKNDSMDNILQCFGENEGGHYYYRYRYDADRVQQYSKKNYLKVFCIDKKSEEVYLRNAPDKDRILEQVFDRSYSIHNLVNIASGEELNGFINKIMFGKAKLVKPLNYVKCNQIDRFGIMLEQVSEALDKRKASILEVAGSFNKEQDGKLEISYEQDNAYDVPPLDSWIYGKEGWPHANNRYFQYKGELYAITCENVREFFARLFLRHGLFEFFQLIRDPSALSQDEVNFFRSLQIDRNESTIDSGVKEVGDGAARRIIEYCCQKMYSQENLSRLIEYLKCCFENTGRYSLRFNVGSRAGGAGKNYRDIKQLSLGQKVVAMLSFILGYSKYAGDYRPLILDQPEDDLDSQYIYNTLVHTLRETKGERQVIIATHNATIVTNAMADQVCVMDSDNKHGWIECTGYPSEKRIKKHILNYLEGGAESFSHKVYIYSPVLDMSVTLV